MKKIVLVFLAGLILSSAQPSNACVGRMLHIGILNSANEQLLAEMVAILLTERTGSNVKVVQFKDSKELYNAVKKGDVGLLIEKLERGGQMIGKSWGPSQMVAFETVKINYRKAFNLVWLGQFGENQHYSPVVSVEVIGNMPALPKLVGKLANVLDTATYNELVRSINTGGSAEKAARRFLKARKLI